jgi:hypothetical protein
LLKPLPLLHFSADFLIMSNRSSDILFQLIHSLEKSEKRHFKLYIKRSSAKKTSRSFKLFDAHGQAAGIRRKSAAEAAFPALKSRSCPT